MLFIIIFGTLPIPITGLRGVSICWLLRNQTLSIDYWTVKNAPRRHCDISNACYGTHATHYSSNIRYVGGGCLALLGIHPIISSPPATYAGRVTDPPGPHTSDSLPRTAQRTLCPHGHLPPRRELCTIGALPYVVVVVANSPSPSVDCCYKTLLIPAIISWQFCSVL